MADPNFARIIYVSRKLFDIKHKQISVENAKPQNSAKAFETCL